MIYDSWRYENLAFTGVVMDGCLGKAPWTLDDTTSE